VEFSLNLSAIYTKWCAQTFPPIFGLFAIFDRNFAKIVAPPSDECENYVACLKEQSLLKKRWKLRLNRPTNGNAMLFKLCTPRTHSAPDSERDQQKKTNTTFFAPTECRRALCDLPQVLHGDRAHLDHQKGTNHFLI